MRITVCLNGTAENPFHRHGLSQNPFPQTGRMEYDRLCLRMQSLGGDPIPHDTAEAYIRARLVGCSDEFVDLCVSQFRPGEYVQFDIAWEERP